MLPTITKPKFGSLYNSSTCDQAIRALQEFNNLLPTIVTQTGGVVDRTFLEHLYFAENMLYAVQTAFNVTDAHGKALVQEAPTPRSVAELAYGVRIFNQLGSLISHPVFEMLAGIQAVRDRCMPIGTLKAIRWMYKPVHKGTSFTQPGQTYPKEVFFELTKGLAHLFDEFELSNQDAIALGCVHDFMHYILDCDSSEETITEFVLVTPQNFGTACALALNALEAIQKTTRHKVK